MPPTRIPPSVSPARLRAYRARTFRLTRSLRLRPYRPDESGQATFPTLGTRIDWILISSGLEFAEHRTLPDEVSDHLAVVAEIVPCAEGGDTTSSR